MTYRRRRRGIRQCGGSEEEPSRWKCSLFSGKVSHTMFVVMEDGGKKRLTFTSHTSHSSHAHGDHGHNHQEEHLDAG